MDQQYGDYLEADGSAGTVTATSILVTILAFCTFILSSGLAGRKNSSSSTGLSGTFASVKTKIERLLVRNSQLEQQQQEAAEAPAAAIKKADRSLEKKGAPPGPTAWPVIGSLHLLAKHEVPFEAFSQLSRIYGDLFSITLGSTPCVVVNSFPLIKEVLIAKGPHFGGRPNFIRYDILFGGDRDNCKSITSLIISFGGKMISWDKKKRSSSSSVGVGSVIFIESYNFKVPRVSHCIDAPSLALISLYICTCCLQLGSQESTTTTVSSVSDRREV